MADNLRLLTTFQAVVKKLGGSAPRRPAKLGRLELQTHGRRRHTFVGSTHIGRVGGPMTFQLVAFTMPFITLAFVGLLAYGVAKHNRRPTKAFQSETYKVTGRFQDGIAHHHP